MSSIMEYVVDDNLLDFITGPLVLEIKKGEYSDEFDSGKEFLRSYLIDLIRAVEMYKEADICNHHYGFDMGDTSGSMQVRNDNCLGSQEETDTFRP